MAEFPFGRSSAYEQAFLEAIGSYRIGLDLAQIAINIRSQYPGLTAGQGLAILREVAEYGERGGTLRDPLSNAQLYGYLFSDPQGAGGPDAADTLMVTYAILDEEGNVVGYRNVAVDVTNLSGNDRQGVIQAIGDAAQEQAESYGYGEASYSVSVLSARPI